ncbi:hypothetical protein WA026_011149 [Henosepilachna vigintioctopunctata]|uniref:Uncharacterized protein n=1 Tax=Henosepilachna vigintioctopunctata TaxID=420089 RepID=A0AAW1U7C4_9CUCU
MYKDTGTLAKGLVDIYLPNLVKAKEHMQELEDKQKILSEHMHEQNLKISKVHDLHLKMEMFDKIKLYEKKLSLLKKDMKQLHDWSVKLKYGVQSSLLQHRPVGFGTGC